MRHSPFLLLKYNMTDSVERDLAVGAVKTRHGQNSVILIEDTGGAVGIGYVKLIP